MGLFARLGRRSPSGSTPGETPRVNPATVVQNNGRGTLAGGVLAADRGIFAYGIGGPQTVRSLSRYPGPGSDQGPTLSPGASPMRRQVVGLHTDTSASPLNPPFPSVVPGGAGALRGRLSGGAWASEAGPIERGPGELVNLRYLPMDPRVVNPDQFSRPIPELQPYRAGRQIISYYIDPERTMGTSPMFSQQHGAIRATPYVSPPPNSQTPHGAANPVVYRPPPMPWDTGVIRGAVPS